MPSSNPEGTGSYGSPWRLPGPAEAERTPVPWPCSSVSNTEVGRSVVAATSSVSGSVEPQGLFRRTTGLPFPPVPSTPTPEGQGELEKKRHAVLKILTKGLERSWCHVVPNLHAVKDSQ